MASRRRSYGLITVETAFFLRGGDTIVPRIKVLVADASETRRSALRDGLVRLGCQVLAEANSVPDMLRKVRTVLPDLVIIDEGLEGGNALEAARIIESDDLAAILIMVRRRDNPDLKEFHYCFYPVTETSLVAAVDAALLYRERIRGLRKEVQKLKETLNTRKVVEKAKGILMKTMNLDEEQAHRLIQKQSMNKGIPVREVARAIILTYEIGKETKD